MSILDVPHGEAKPELRHLLHVKYSTKELTQQLPFEPVHRIVDLMDDRKDDDDDQAPFTDDNKGTECPSNAASPPSYAGHGTTSVVLCLLRDCHKLRTSSTSAPLISANIYLNFMHAFCVRT